MRRQDARRHHRQHQIALAAGLGGDQCRQAQALQGQRHGLHLAVRTRRGNRERLRYRLPGLTAQRRADGLDLRHRQARQIGQRALADLAAVAIGLAQQHRRR